MGRNTASAIQLAKMVTRMIYSKVLVREVQDNNNNYTDTHSHTAYRHMHTHICIHNDSIHTLINTHTDSARPRMHAYIHTDTHK